MNVMVELWWTKWLPMVLLTAALIVLGVAFFAAAYKLGMGMLCAPGGLLIALAVWLPETWYTITMLHIGEQATKEDMSE